MATTTETIRWERDEDGVVGLVFDDPTQSANTFNAAFIESLGRAVDRLEAEREGLTGVVLTSAKKTFFAGDDLLGAALAYAHDVAVNCSPTSIVVMKGQIHADLKRV